MGEGPFDGVGEAREFSPAQVIEMLTQERTHVPTTLEYREKAVHVMLHMVANGLALDGADALVREARVVEKYLREP